MLPAAHTALSEFIVDRLEVGLLAVDTDMRVVLWNRFMALHSGKNADAVIGNNLFDCFPDLPRKWLEKKIRNVFILKNYSFTSWEQRPYLFRFHHNRPATGGVDTMQQSCTFLPMRDGRDEVSHVCITLFDHTDTAIYQQSLMRVIADLEREKAEQRRLIAKLDEAQSQMLQSEKLASIGQLAAGVAHEINNPVGFVNSNLGTLENYVRDLMRVVDAYGDWEDAANEALLERVNSARRLKREIDFDFLRDDVDTLIRESKDGLDRVKRIVQDLKDFSRIDHAADWEKTDIHRCLDSTLNVVANELKFKAELVRQYGALPAVECRPSQLNQVFLNLMVNAAQAIRERGIITLATGSEADWVWIAVTDTGRGIDPEHLKRIFDPFFTTKPVGQGTGLGLSVSRNIVAKHNGRIEVDSTIGQGTTFRVWLPVDQQKIEE